MPSAVVASALAPAELSGVQEFISARAADIGFRPLSDEAWAELGHGPTGRLLTVRLADEHSELVGFAIASNTPATDSAHGATWTLETVSHGDDAVVAGLLAQLLEAAVPAIVAAGGTELSWLVQSPSALHDTIATDFGWTPRRRLHQMSRVLPTGIAFDIATREFEPERDLVEWVQVNNRAFAWNPEQGSWTEANVLARMDEPWFDPAGFLIHEHNGRMAGFCWTKIHPDTAPLLGEIYVIAVDPEHHGHGLGRALTLAGLDSLARRGAEVGMLFVDADNVSAIHLYDTLGFVIQRTDCRYEGRIG